MKKTLIVTCIVVALAAGSALAQPGPPPGGGQPGGPAGPGAGPQQGPAPDVVLKEVLGFTDEQLSALRGLLDTRRQAHDTLASQLADAEKALADAAKATNPDPTQLGTLLLKVNAVRQQVQQVDDAFKTAARKLLTPAQQQKIDDIVALEKSLGAAQLLHGLGF
jgi:Spy/CpxP family protein refolding chaperone